MPEKPENVWVPMQVASFHEQDNFYYKLLQADGIDPEQFRLKQRQEFDVDSDKDLTMYNKLCVYHTATYKLA